MHRRSEPAPSNASRSASAGLFLLRYNIPMALSWAKRRKFLYTTVISVIAFVILVFVYVQFFTSTPTCFDGKFNGDEHGIDCGGSCALLCRDETRSPVVLWSRAFEVAPSTYTAAAYVQNPNIGAAARNVAYSFQLFDANNALVVERIGTINIPPVSTVPFIDPNINVGNRTVARAIFSFSQEPVWVRVSGLVSLRVGNQYLSPDGSQLSATLINDSINDANNVTIAAVLFDAQGVARAASRSVISRVPHKGSQNVNFTWPAGVQNIVRAEITVLPSF